MLAVGLGIGAAVASTPGTAAADDMQISIDGIDLFPTAGNTATAASGFGDMAIAIGNGSNAVAGEINNGIFDFAFADGAFSSADAGASGNLDSAIVIGAGDIAAAGPGGNRDSATIIGNNSDALASDGDGNLVYVVNPGNAPDFAEAGGLFGLPNFFGNNDIALIMGTGSIADAGSNASTSGNFDLAAVFTDMLHAFAVGGNFLTDILP
jgi:hypothetical protein